MEHSQTHFTMPDKDITIKKKIKNLQAEILEESKYKNSQQNTGKLNFNSALKGSYTMIKWDFSQRLWQAEAAASSVAFPWPWVSVGLLELWIWGREREPCAPRPWYMVC